MRTQDLSADERPRARPQPLGLPTPGPGESCRGHYAECRSVPCGGPADHPASHGGELVHARHDQVDQHQDERDPPVEERAHPAVRWHACGALAELACVLCLLCCVPRATGALCPTKRMPLPIGWSDGMERALLSAA